MNDNFDVISPDDQMWLECGQNEKHYKGVGSDVMDCVVAASSLPGAFKQSGPFESILDMGCSFGRVLRHFRRFWPEANIYAADIRKDGVDFCAETFEAKPVYTTSNFSSLVIDAQFDLIYAGSLVTHLCANDFESLLLFFHRQLKTGGIALFTTHGLHCEKLAAGGNNYGLSNAGVEDALAAGGGGYGFSEYPGATPQSDAGAVRWGVSFIRPSWMCRELGAMCLWRLLLVTERGIDNHQDLYAIQKL